MPVSAAPEYFYGDRLSPLPEDRKSVIKIDPLVDANQLASWKKENVEFVRRALKNLVYLPNYSFAEHQRRADQHAPYPQDPSWRGGNIVQLAPTNPTIVCDHDGVVGLICIPSFLKRISLGSLNHSTLEFMRHEIAPRKSRDGSIKIVGSSNNGKARGGADTYTTNQGVFGTATYAVAWHQQAHENSHGFEPSRSLTQSSSGIQSHLRAQFLSSTRNLHFRLNHLISLLHPSLHQLLLSVRSLISQHPTVHQLLSLWDSLFLGHSVILNRTSGEHLDSHSVRRGFDGLLAAGNFRGGDLFFKDMNLQLQFEPGTLVLFDGTCQRHSVLGWTGEQRISNAFFVHRSVFEELAVDTSLSDITIHDLAEHLASNPSSPKSKSNKRKRKGRGQGRAAKSAKTAVAEQPLS